CLVVFVQLQSIMHSSKGLMRHNTPIIKAFQPLQLFVLHFLGKYLLSIRHLLLATAFRLLAANKSP
ncbi:MAG: hypothetical protein D3923_19535, partial [Candidatus Electrothrix sp. AR3]|nr:hypothetical protein [Candidatus Electrothrix sp. AR3]